MSRTGSSASFARRPDFGPVTERHVQALWYDRSMRPERLVTRRGSEVRVVHPGEWNLGPGPDFTGAVLEIGRDRRRLEGDVEVHLCPADWTRHGHGEDPNYRNVVAHVTWRSGPVPRSLPSGAVSIWLGRFFAGDPSFSTDRIDLDAYPFAELPASPRPCSGSVGADPDAALAVLHRAGAVRLRRKAGRFGRMLAGGRSREQVFYGEVMGAFGYSRNAEGFRSVAAAVPVGCVVAEPENAAAAFLAAAQFVTWDRCGVRPRNAPEARLAAAAAVLTETGILSLAGADAFARGDCRAMVSAMTVGGHLGRGRAAAVLANVVVPFALCEGRIWEVPEWLPPEDVSHPARLMAFRMFGRDHNPALWSGDGVAIQGLLEIESTVCRGVHPDCGSCRLAKEAG